MIATMLLPSRPISSRTTQGDLVLRVVGSSRNGQIVRLRSTKCTIGADPYCTLRLRARGVAPMHCLILRGPAGAVVRSWAADTRLNQRAFNDAPLASGDRIGVGPIELEVVDVGAVSQLPELPPERHETTGDASAESQERVALAEQRRVLAEEQDAQSEERRALANLQDTLVEQRQALADVENALAEERRALAEERTALTDQRRALSEEQNTLAGQRHELTEGQNALADQRRELTEEQESLAEQRRALAEEQNVLEARQRSLADEQNALTREQKALAEARLALSEKQAVSSAAAAAEVLSQTPTRQSPVESTDVLRRVGIATETSEEGNPPRQDQDEAIEGRSSPARPMSYPEAESPANSAETAAFAAEAGLPVASGSISQAVAEEQTTAVAGPERPAAHATGEGEAEEESIDAYMSRLMERIRAAQGEPAPVPTPIQTPASMPEPAIEEPTAAAKTAPSVMANDVEAAAPAARETVPEEEPTTAAPRSKAPEKLFDFSAMRDLANMSAQEAIRRYTRRVMVGTMYSKLLVAIVAMAAGLALLWFWSRPNGWNMTFYSALAALLITIYWGVEYAILTGRLIVTKSGHVDWNPLNGRSAARKTPQTRERQKNDVSGNREATDKTSE